MREIGQLEGEEGKPQQICHDKPQGDPPAPGLVTQCERGEPECQAADQQDHRLYEYAREVERFLGCGTVRQPDRLAYGGVGGEHQAEDDEIAYQEDPEAEDHRFRALMRFAVAGFEVQAGVQDEVFHSAAFQIGAVKGGETVIAGRDLVDTGDRRGHMYLGQPHPVFGSDFLGRDGVRVGGAEGSCDEDRCNGAEGQDCEPPDVEDKRETRNGCSHTDDESDRCIVRHLDILVGVGVGLDIGASCRLGVGKIVNALHLRQDREIVGRWGRWSWPIRASCRSTGRPAVPPVPRADGR